MNDLIEAIMGMDEWTQREFLPAEVENVTELKVPLTREALTKALSIFDLKKVIVHAKRFATSEVKLEIRSRSLRD